MGGEGAQVYRVPPGGTRKTASLLPPSLPCAPSIPLPLPFPLPPKGARLTASGQPTRPRRRARPWPPRCTPLAPEATIHVAGWGCWLLVAGCWLLVGVQGTVWAGSGGTQVYWRPRRGWGGVGRGGGQGGGGEGGGGTCVRAYRPEVLGRQHPVRRLERVGQHLVPEPGGWGGWGGLDGQLGFPRPVILHTPPSHITRITHITNIAHINARKLNKDQTGHTADC